MKPVTINLKSQAIVYDADVLPGAGEELFDPAWWRVRDAVTGSAPGRGSALFLDTPQGPAVLRQYLRGGWAAKLSNDRYFYTGVEKSRPFLEFRLLAAMRDAGLRVPVPIAAMCARSGPFYRGALLTRRIQPASALADHFTDTELDWSRLGRELREFHDAGMDHADLNARNILVHANDNAAWVLDLDRSTFNPGKAVDGTANLARLKRSVIKLWPPADQRLENCWQALEEGHHG